MKLKVVVAVNNWLMGGANNFVANLVPGLVDEGVDARVLFTGWAGWFESDANLPVPTGFPLEIAPWIGQRSWHARWAAMIEYLETLAPCVYLPNYDWAYSCVSPRLSDRVVIVGHMHSDHAEFYEHFERLGRYFNQTVAGSEHLRAKLAAQYPRLAERLCVLPYGVTIPSAPPARTPAADAPLRIMYSGRLYQEAKRVLDLPKIVEELDHRRIPVRLSITGWGADEQALRARCRHLSDRGLVEFCGLVSEERLHALYEENDVIILTSDYEGKPISLVEGMGRGCIPVATDIPSGIPELVHDGVNGYRVPVGAIDTFADRLAALHRDRGLRERLSARAFQTVSSGGYRITDMVANYSELFRRLTREAADGQFHRARGRIRLPPRLADRPSWDQPNWKDLLPEPIRTVGRHCKGALRWAYERAAHVEAIQHR